MSIDASDPLILETLKRYAARHTLPLQRFLDDGRATHEGTATLLEIGHRAFLVTAAHVFDGVSLDEFVVPPSLAGGQAVPLSFQLYRPKEEDKYDVAVLELTDADAIMRLRAGWSSLSLDSISRPSAAFGGMFAVCGYPESRVRRQAQGVACSLIAAFTERMKEPPTNTKFAVEPGIDMFFHYDPEATDTAGEPIATPQLHGVSGASVWEYHHAIEGAWEASKALKVVGVQASFREGEWFRATTWNVVLAMLRMIDTELERATAPAIERLSR